MVVSQAPGVLSQAQVDHFWEHGYVLAPGAIDAAEIAALRAELDGWIEESRGHTANYGTDTADGKARFDLEEGHSAETPKLRRVANPVDISETYRHALWDSVIPDMVADLIGANVKFHHCKLNVKLPSMDTYVGWHQDHPFDPHTNDDMVTMLLMLDDVTEDRGPLRVVPGSYREHYSHVRDGKFVGETDPALAADFEARSVPILAKAGDVCLMHTWTVHGGGPNRSDEPRRLLICDYNAADAYPLTRPAVPSPHYGRILRGEPSRVARLRETTVEIREAYDDDSFFGLQGQATAGESETKRAGRA